MCRVYWGRAGQGGQEGQAGWCFPGLDVRDPRHFHSQTPGPLKAYACALLCTMAQTLVFLVLIMDILGLPQWGSSYSGPQAVAWSACRGELEEDPKRRPWMLQVREGSRREAERKGRLEEGFGNTPPAKKPTWLW